MVVEALIGAAAKAIFGRALDAVAARLKLDERLLGRAKADPAQTAFKAALARAYAAFARQYPDLTPSLFTEPFLAGAAAPELAKLAGGQTPDPITFAQRWIAEPHPHVTSPQLRAPDGTPTSLAVEASAHFLRLLEAELRHDPHFRAIFDSRALDALPEIGDKLDRLNEQLRRAIQDAEAYRIAIEGVHTQGSAAIANSTVTTGRDFIGRDQIINHYYLADRYDALKVFYDPPDYVFRQVNVAAFVGRAALKQEIDDFIAKHRSGLFLIEGEAGLGKTTLLAHLVYTRGYLHVFGGRFEGETNRPNAVAHLAAQVVSRYHIESYRDGVSLELARSPHFLQRLLEQAAGERIVIAYDALDQGGAPNDESNPLGLPRSLPDGVIVLATQRPVQHPPRCDAAASRVYRLEAGDPEN
ncbi:MAG: hypothetical protein KatS3mg053_1852 [Candidatus Roseilinea sp.]|nr:MAG: hypothetical protein KatS3mg053_1852 [Candidatus Roseilinea sp.]